MKPVLTALLFFVLASPTAWASADSLEKVKQKFSQEAQEKNDRQWRACSDSNECVAVQGVCDLACVNVKFKDEAGSYYHEYGTMVDCASVRHESMPRPICRQARCVCEYPSEAKE